MDGCIVCGVDESEGAREAARVAAALSEVLGTRLVVVNARELPVVGGMPARPEVYDEFREAEVRQGNDLLAAIARELDVEQPSEWRVEFGPPVEILADAAEDERAMLLVVGSRGLGKIRSTFAKTVSAQLPSESPCPVVIVPEGTVDRVASERGVAEAAGERERG